MDNKNNDKTKATFYLIEENFSFIKNIKRKSNLINKILTIYKQLDSSREKNDLFDYSIVEIFQYGISFLTYMKFYKYEKEREMKKDDC